MIEAASLVCGYGRNDVLRDIHFRVRPGEFIGILGPNGTGKSTFLLTLGGVLPYRQGSIRISGEEIAGTSQGWRAKRIGSVQQRTEISFPFKCLSVVLMGRYPYISRWGGYSLSDREAALQAMEDTGTIHLAERMITEVSGGEAQRVIIARALAQQTDLLFLDEATSSLDVSAKIRIFDLLRRKNGSGTTILCAMHDLNLAALYCRRLLFLKDRSIVLDGSTEETFKDETLSRIYETDVRVCRHPVTNDPQALFVPGAHHGPGSAYGGAAASGCGPGR
ncbi:MAG: ABC transporter ATP-binding protein [Desulfobacteraceae bacterium]|nr:MAG: ABC transporter ATP-binding protein [Desulfobacteraceae bacterium]